MTIDARRASSPALEIAVTGTAGALVARDGGADRVELCSALELGGVTPSQGLTEAVVETGVAVHALVRCRPGGFAYDADELGVMMHEVRALVASGVAGVVVGALRSDGSLDAEAVRRLVDAARDAAARPLEVTVHRAVDRAAYPVAAVAALAPLGVTRVLTSGGESTVAAGLASGVLSRMVSVADGVQVMAGGGVQLTDLDRLVEARVDAVHLSAKRVAALSGLEGEPTGDVVSLGTAASSDTWFETDPAVVRAARAALSASR